LSKILLCAASGALVVRARERCREARGSSGQFASCRRRHCELAGARQIRGAVLFRFRDPCKSYRCVERCALEGAFRCDTWWAHRARDPYSWIVLLGYAGLAVALSLLLCSARDGVVVVHLATTMRSTNISIMRAQYRCGLSLHGLSAMDVASRRWLARLV
jgi:hypothetical protein